MLTAVPIDSPTAGERLTISTKGSVVIPATICKKYGLRPGSQLTLVDYGGLLALIPHLAEPLEQMRGILAGATSLTQTLLKERQIEQQREHCISDHR